ncbi:vascular cell adhesion protein 1 isoform X3 [Melanerpes formicivorus]|uniref:vascular cell adhesion protein 1 isoform X3 n=1 Tax=Melanerpes formicivorus TaxID=211600 RepID=UPI00358FD8A4
MLKEMGRTSQDVVIILCLLMTVKAFEMEIVPANRIVAQIGETLTLTCNTTGCASPSFSWRTQMDNPLGGTVNNHKTYSTLIMNPVRVVNSHDYLCTVFCGEKDKKEKSIKVEIYSFPSDPVIEISPSLVSGELATVICKIPNVYPSDHLEVLLMKGEHVLFEKTFHEEVSTNVETKTVAYSFNLKADDIGKEITCVAKLPIADMDFEPKERVTSKKLNADFGPRNTNITASPGAPKFTELSIEPSTTVQEGENVSIQCSADGNPPPKIILRRKSDGADTRPYSEGRILLPSVTFLSGGNYECVAKNKFGESESEITLNVEYGPRNTMISIIPAAVVKEGETVTMECTSSGNPAPLISWKKKESSGESEKIFKEATLTIQNIKIQDLGLYECEAYNKFGKEEKSVNLLVQGKLEGTDQMIPLIIAFSSAAATAVPVVAILIYLSRKAKINGSYSLVKALRLKV